MLQVRYLNGLVYNEVVGLASAWVRVSQDG